MIRPTEEQSSVVQLEIDTYYPCAIVHASGLLDEGSVPAFRDVLYNAMDRGYRDLIVEMSEVRGISSVGISAFLCAIRRFENERGRIALVGCSPSVADVFRIVGLDQLFLIYPDLDRARSALFQAITQKFEPILENGAKFRSWLRSLIASVSPSATEMDGVEAAASEGFFNAVQHTSPRKDSIITVRVFLGSAVTVEIEDQGPGFEARQYFAADPSCLPAGARGLGIYVMRNLMDQVEFVAGVSGTPDSPAGTTVRLVKRLRVPDNHPKAHKQGPRRSPHTNGYQGPGPIPSTPGS